MNVRLRSRVRIIYYVISIPKYQCLSLYISVYIYISTVVKCAKCSVARDVCEFCIFLYYVRKLLPLHLSSKHYGILSSIYLEITYIWSNRVCQYPIFHSKFNWLVWHVLYEPNSTACSNHLFTDTNSPVGSPMALELFQQQFNKWSDLEGKFIIWV